MPRNRHPITVTIHRTCDYQTVTLCYYKTCVFVSSECLTDLVSF